MSMRLVLAGVFSSCFSLLVSPASAGTWGYFGSYQLDYSDNIERINEGGTSGVYHTLSAGVGYEEHGTRLDANIDGSVAYIHYPSDVFDDETRLYLDGDLRWALVRDRLFWVVTDLLTSEPINSRAPNVPANLQQTNVFATGPSLRYQFDLANRVQADMRYMNSWAEEIDTFNSDRWFLGGSWIYGSANATDISLSATFYDVDFDRGQTAGVEDYRRGSIFAGWERRNGPSSLRIEAGLINIDFDESDSESGWHGLAEWNHIISSSSSLVVSARHGLTDSALSIAAAVDPESIGTNVISGQVYEVNAADVSFGYDLTVSAIQLRASYEKQDYITVGELDRELASAAIHWTRAFGGGWSSRLSGRIGWAEYEDGRSDDTYFLYAGVEYLGTRNLTYSLGANWERRDSSAPASEYDSAGVVFLVRYTR
ncbi:hypothetical protein [Thiolapillus sp.]